jgi:hypothetical protein
MILIDMPQRALIRLFRCTRSGLSTKANHPGEWHVLLSKRDSVTEAARALWLEDDGEYVHGRNEPTHGAMISSAQEHPAGQRCGCY